MPTTSDVIARTYARLRAAAARRVPPGATLSPTALVHEVFLKLRQREWVDTVHFRRVAGSAMRQVLADRARRQRSAKRGGGRVRVTLPDLGVADGAVDVLEIDAALVALERTDARKAQVAELKIFAGLELDEIALELGVSRTTVKNEWRAARAFVAAELQLGAPDDGAPGPRP